uniref:Uncharacterized protein n=1 Tax=Megaselia scalaris TaxID=36166 RepID=T1GQG8_MEGSC
MKVDTANKDRGAKYQSQTLSATDRDDLIQQPPAKRQALAMYQQPMAIPTMQGGVTNVGVGGNNQQVVGGALSYSPSHHPWGFCIPKPLWLHIQAPHPLFVDIQFTRNRIKLCLNQILILSYGHIVQ